VNELFSKIMADFINRMSNRYWICFKLWLLLFLASKIQIKYNISLTKKMIGKLWKSIFLTSWRKYNSEMYLIWSGILKLLSESSTFLSWKAYHIICSRRIPNLRNTPYKRVPRYIFFPTKVPISRKYGVNTVYSHFELSKSPIG
jgi:hypothetical protein